MAGPGHALYIGVRCGGQLQLVRAGVYGRAAARCAPKALRRSGRAHRDGSPRGASRPTCPAAPPIRSSTPVMRLRAQLARAARRAAR